MTERRIPTFFLELQFEIFFLKMPKSARSAGGLEFVGDGKQEAPS